MGWPSVEGLPSRGGCLKTARHPYPFGVKFPPLIPISATEDRVAFGRGWPWHGWPWQWLAMAMLAMLVAMTTLEQDASGRGVLSSNLVRELRCCISQCGPKQTAVVSTPLFRSLPGAG